MHHLRLPRRHHPPLGRHAEGQDQPGEGRIYLGQAVRGVEVFNLAGPGRFYVGGGSHPRLQAGLSLPQSLPRKCGER